MESVLITVSGHWIYLAKDEKWDGQIYGYGWQLEVKVMQESGKNLKKDGVLEEKKIKNSQELEFVIFCIENIAAEMGVDAERVYKALAEKSNILNDYIVPGYEILHTQSKEYIIDDIMELMKERGVSIWFYIMVPGLKFQIRIYPIPDQM